VSLELSEQHAAVARANLAAAGFGEVAEVIAGPALESLAGLAGPFDLVFLDADKRRHDAYFEAALRLSRPGTLIVADNVVRDGRVLAPEGDPEVEGVRRLVERLSGSPEVIATAVQTVGVKGWDGFVLALVA
jgi:predicted O-methyltransferase YrrM